MQRFAWIVSQKKKTYFDGLYTFDNYPITNLLNYSLKTYLMWGWGWYQTHCSLSDMPSCFRKYQVYYNKFEMHHGCDPWCIKHCMRSNCGNLIQNSWVPICFPLHSDLYGVPAGNKTKKAKWCNKVEPFSICTICIGYRYTVSWLWKQPLGIKIVFNKIKYPKVNQNGMDFFNFFY